MRASFQRIRILARSAGSRLAIRARASPASFHDPAVGTTTRPSRSKGATSPATDRRPTSSRAPARSSADTTEARKVRGARSPSRSNVGPPTPSRKAATYTLVSNIHLAGIDVFDVSAALQHEVSERLREG